MPGICFASRRSPVARRPQVEFECEGTAPVDPKAVAVLGTDMWVEEPVWSTTTPHPTAFQSNLLDTEELDDELAVSQVLYPSQINYYTPRLRDFQRRTIVAGG